MEREAVAGRRTQGRDAFEASARGCFGDATGTRPAKDDIHLLNERFGTSFDAQDIVDGVTQQLMDSEEIQRAAKANPRANFDLVGAPAFDEALVDRHAKHAEFIDRVFADEELLRFIRTRVLDDIYSRLTGTTSSQ